MRFSVRNKNHPGNIEPGPVPPCNAAAKLCELRAMASAMQSSVAGNRVRLNRIR